MSKTGLRGLVARFFGGGQDSASETRESLERATGAPGTSARPAPSEDGFDQGDKGVPPGRPPT